MRVLAAACGLLLAAAPGVAAPPLSGRAYELADEAYKALEANELDRAIGLATEALTVEPGHPSLLMLQADVLARQGKPAEAAERLRALSPQDLGGQGLAQRGYLALALGDPKAAEADFAQALKTGDLDAGPRANLASELAYLALRRGDDAAAERWFALALPAAAPGASRGRLYADAGYAAIRLGRNHEAVKLLSRAVDEWHAAPATDKPFNAEALYDMRRSIDTLERRFGATFSVGHSNATVAGVGLAPLTGARVVQAGAEVYYRPGGFGFRDGRIFELYANGFRSLHSSDESIPTGSESSVAGVGVRYKPLREHNFMLAAEYRGALGDRAGEDDLLLRLGWSMSGGTDWKPVQSSWLTWQVYAEGVYFTRSARLIVPFDARAGYSWKLLASGSLVVTPFAGAAGDYDEFQADKWGVGIGPGIVLRYWFRETRHRAYSSYLDFSLQYRFRATDAPRAEGFFGQVTLAF